jgi:sugar (pentulose or hexulose) kinase
MHEPLFIGLDAGTSSLKGLLVNCSGQVMAAASREYQLETKDNLCELDPSIYWNSAVCVIRELISSSEVSVNNIIAVAIASQGETLICLDENGCPLRKAIVWLDNRSIKEAEKLADDIGVEKIFSITGQPEIAPLLPATKILWLRQHEPVTFRKTFKYLLVEDYLLYMLTGKFVTDPAVSSSTSYLDIKNKTWWNEILEYLEIKSDQLPEILSSGTSIGRIKPEAAGQTGLPPSAVAVSGAYDHVAGAIGAGNFREGLVSLTVGSSMAMVVTLDKPIFDLSMNLPCQCHAQVDRYFLQPYGQTTGMVFRWFRDEFCGEEKIAAKKAGEDTYDLMTSLAAQVPAGSGGLVMLPHLTGAGSPEYNFNARGVFEGITLEMGKPHFIRAIMESVAFLIRKNLELIKGRSTGLNELRALGGAARSPLWNQIIADVTGIPLRTLSITEVPALGAAILAGTGAALFSNLEEGIKNMVMVKDDFSPRPGNKRAYDEAFNHYIRLYSNLEDYWKNKNDEH